MSSRWSKNQNVGDCKTCLCRISPQKTRPDSQVEDETTETAGGTTHNILHQGI